MTLKQSLLSLLSLILLLTITTYAYNDNPPDKDAVKSTVQKYVNSVDTKDVSALQNTFFDKGTISIYNTFLNKVDSYSLSDFVDMVKSGDKGGWTRNLDIKSVEVNKNTAIADIDITDPKIKQEGFVTLVKDNGEWKITGAVFSLGSNK